MFVRDVMFIFLILIWYLYVDYSTEHLKTGLMILEAYVLIAPERVISVSIRSFNKKAKIQICCFYKCVFER